MARRKASARRVRTQKAAVKKSGAAMSPLQYDAEVKALEQRLKQLFTFLVPKYLPRFEVVTIKGGAISESLFVGGGTTTGENTTVRRGDWICWVNMDNMRYTVDFFVPDDSGGRRNPFVPSCTSFVVEPNAGSGWLRISQVATRGSGDGQKYAYHVVPDSGAGGGPDGPDIIIE